MLGAYRLVCSGCKKTLKVELSEIPEQDFSIECPRCRNPVVVRIAAVRAAMARPAPPGAKPSEGAGVWEGEAPAPPADLPVGALPRGMESRDVTDAILSMNAERPTVAPVEEPLAVDAPVAESSAQRRAPRVVPSNAPRTNPRLSMPPSEPGPPWGMIAGIGGAALVLVSLTAFLVHRRHSPPAEKAPIASTVESDASVQKDIAALKQRYPDPGGTAKELFAAGLGSMRGDSSAELLDAADKFRRAIAADPRDSEPLAALAMALTFLPRSERDGLGVAQANQWADYVQRTRPDSLLGQDSRAVLLSSLGRDGDAIALADGQRAAHQDDALAWFVHGWILQRKDPAAAAVSLRHALTIAPDFRLAQSELAEAELRAGHLKAAQDAVDSRLAAGNVSGAIERTAGLLALELGEIASARKHLEDAVSLEPKDVEARLAAGWSAIRAGELGIAQAHARHVLDVDRPAQDASEEQVADAQLLLADALRRAGKPIDAVAAAKLAVHTHPSKAAAEYELGLALLAAGRGDEAAESLKDASQREPSRAQILVALGSAQLKASRVEDAVAAYQAALAADPDEARAHVGLAIAWFDADLPTRAQDEFSRLVDGTHPLAPLLRGEDSHFPEPPIDLDAALSRLHKVEANDPNRDARYRLWEGALYCLAGRSNEGLPKMVIAGLDPAGSATAAGWALAAGRGADAVRLTAQAESAREQTTRGWALKTMKMAGDDRAFDLALASDPNDPYAALGKAQSLLQHGKKKDAAPLLEIAKKLGPSPALARATLASQ